MTSNFLRPLALSASILILGATSTAAFAQPAPPPAPMAGARDGEWRHHQRPDPAVRAQHHAEHLRAALQLTPLNFACALLGGVAFAFIGGIGAALSLGARRGGLLTAVIVLPLFVPPVIFGGGAIDAFASGLPWKGGFAFLGAYAAAAVAMGPLAMAAACRNALS